MCVAQINLFTLTHTFTMYHKLSWMKASRPLENNVTGKNEDSLDILCFPRSQKFNFYVAERWETERTLLFLYFRKLRECQGATSSLYAPMILSATRTGSKPSRHPRATRIKSICMDMHEYYVSCFTRNFLNLLHMHTVNTWLFFLFLLLWEYIHDIIYKLRNWGLGVKLACLTSLHTRQYIWYEY